MLHALGISRATLYADAGRILTPEEQAAYEHLILRRLANEPIQYITGEQEFYSLALQVTPDVLIPRPETEHLVEAVLSQLDPAAPLQILDVGTGSGAIAIALAHHLPHAQVTATDIAPAALAVAATNAARHHVAARIRFVESDLLNSLGSISLSGVAQNVNGAVEQPVLSLSKEPAVLAAPRIAFDAIVSNPPYVSTVDRETLHPQVRDFEPANALFAGPDGVDIYRRLIPQAHAALKPGGLLALEIGHGQRNDVAHLLLDWNDLHFVEDLQQIPRVALARKQ